MNTNLKVSHKVYLGFGIIVVLLLISSIVSIVNLGKTRDSTLHVKDVAVPIQKQSNLLQINLLKQAKLSTLSFNHTSVAAIQTSRRQFAEVTEHFNRDFTALNRLVSDDPDKKAILSDTGSSYRVYVEVVSQMLDAIEQRIQSDDVISQSHNDIITAMDEAGALLLEMSYLEDEKNQAALDQIAGAANQLDGYLLNVLNTAKETTVATSVQQVQKSQETVAFTISNLDSQVNYLKQLTEGINTEGLMAQFLTEYAKGSRLLIGQNNLLELKQKQLELAANARQHLQTSENAVNQASNHLDKLLHASNQQFNRLQQENLSNLDDGRSRAIVMMVVLVSIGIGAAVYTTREMINPLDCINDILSYMAQGDLTRKLDCSKQDEFGLLSKHINEVVDDLTELITEIHANATQLSSAAIDSSNEMQQMTSSVEEQKQKVSQVTDITSQMNQSVSHVAGQAQSAANEMLQALEQSRQVDGIAKDNNTRINELEMQLEHTTSIIDKLQVESNNIGGILETIGAIAEQTNLLALNAAIEAARAGEQGRGFAVVADEVRSLAARTQQSTAEIKTMIDTLQSQTNIAVNDINEGKAKATECVRHTDELTQSLSQINAAINKMQGMSGEIADSAKQQLDQSQRINEEILQVSHIADKNAEKASSSLAYSSQVGKLADALNGSVNNFKV